MSGALTDKQKRVLEIINRFGVMNSTQLLEIFEGEISAPAIYATKKKLVKMDFINEEKLGLKLIIWIRPGGVKFLGSELTSFSKISYSRLGHQFIMNDCLIKTYKRYLQNEKVEKVEYVTEREIRTEYIETHLSYKEKRDSNKLQEVYNLIPDFILKFTTNDTVYKVAYEIELTSKTKARYDRKFKQYQEQIRRGDFSKVFYICEHQSTIKLIESIASQYLHRGQHYGLINLSEVIKGG